MFKNIEFKFVQVRLRVNIQQANGRLTFSSVAIFNHSVSFYLLVSLMASFSAALKYPNSFLLVSRQYSQSVSTALASIPCKPLIWRICLAIYPNSKLHSVTSRDLQMKGCRYSSYLLIFVNYLSRQRVSSFTCWTILSLIISGAFKSTVLSMVVLNVPVRYCASSRDQSNILKFRNHVDKRGHNRS